MTKQTTIVVIGSLRVKNHLYNLFDLIARLTNEDNGYSLMLSHITSGVYNSLQKMGNNSWVIALLNAALV